MGRLNKAKLEAAIGGAEILRDLLDKDFDGVADEVLVEKALRDAESEAASAIELVYDLGDPRLDESLVLEDYKLKLAVYHAYKIGTAGQAIPQDVRDDYDKAIAWFDKLANRQRGAGVRNPPATSIPVEVVDIDPQRTRTSRRNMKGFC
jgi:phage gp36-like protein